MGIHSSGVDLPKMCSVDIRVSAPSVLFNRPASVVRPCLLAQTQPKLTTFGLRDVTLIHHLGGCRCHDCSLLNGVRPDAHCFSFPRIFVTTVTFTQINLSLKELLVKMQLSRILLISSLTCSNTFVGQLRLWNVSGLFSTLLTHLNILGNLEDHPVQYWDHNKYMGHWSLNCIGQGHRTVCREVRDTVPEISTSVFYLDPA